MTANLIDVCVCLTEKNEISSIFVDLVFFISCWCMRQFLFWASWDFSHIAHFALMMNIWQTFFRCFDFSHRSHFEIERHWFSMWSYRQQL
jgi:hypothetical protein